MMYIRSKARSTISRVCAMMFALALVCVGIVWPVPASAQGDGMLRVRLARLGAPSRIALSADCDYILASDPAVRVKSGDTVTIAADGDALTLIDGDTRVSLGHTARLMRSRTGNRGIRFLQPELSNRFCGDLGLSASGGVISAILNIYVENYLYGVVGYAMPPSSGLEALKAQAVASRTWALRRRATRSDAAYDVTDTAAEQPFKGYNDASDYANVVRAVDDTRGQALYYNGSLAQCCWCASNGGQTESARNAWGTNLPYAVVKDDGYDFESTAAAVRAAVVSKDLSDIRPELRAALTAGVRAELADKGVKVSEEEIRLDAIESVTACESRFDAPSRLYKSLTFKVDASVRRDGEVRSGAATVSVPTYGGVEKWYGLSLNDGDTETVWVTETEAAFNIAFRRSGSGVGLSQRGAQVMAATYGRRAPEILAFYYPGTELRKLDLADDTRDLAVAAPKADQKPIATARLNDKTDLRGAANDDGPVTAVLAAGAVVDVYGVQGEWAAVGSSGKYGFMPVDRLESFTLTGGDVTREEEPVYATVIRDADILQLPVRGAKAVGSAAKGTRLRVYAWTEGWIMTDAGGGRGFAAREDLDFAGRSASESAPGVMIDSDQFVAAEGDITARLKQDAPLFETANALSTALETLRSGDTVRVLAYSRDWARVRAQSGREGYLRLECVTAEAEKAGIEGGEIHKVKGKKYMFVQGDGATLYESWSTESAALASLTPGKRVRVGAYNEKWACVRVDGVTGFVEMSALAAKVPAAIDGGAFNRFETPVEAVARERAALYATPSEGAEKLGTMDEGERVTLRAANARWAQAEYGDRTGYVLISAFAQESESPDALTGNVTRKSCDARITAEASVLAAPKDKARAIGRLNKGDVVRVAAWNERYAYIEYDGGSGFVRIKYLEKL